MSLKKIVKNLSFVLISFFLGFTVLTFVNHNVASADIIDELGKVLKVNPSNEISFTQYSGELTQLEANGLDKNLTASSDLKEYILKIVNFALGFLGLIAVLIVIYGGVLYVTAAGEDDRMQTGKKAITYAAIGLLIVLGSFAFVNTVIKGAGGKGDQAGRSVVGANTGASFNAAATEIRNIAEKIYRDFAFFADVNEEVKTMINDLNKSSLSYENRNLVAQADILNYLYSVKEKLTNIRNKVEKFSSSYTRINELLRNIDTYIDKVRNANKVYYAKTDDEGKLYVCNLEKLDDNSQDQDVLVDTAEDVGDFFISIAESIDCENNYEEYPIDLWQLWADVGSMPYVLERDVNESNLDNLSSYSLKYIIEPIKQDFKRKVAESLQELYTIRQSLSGIEIVETGGIGKLYTEMNDLYGFDPASPKGPYSKGFLKAIEDWKLSTEEGQIDQSGELLLNAIKKQLLFADEVEKLKSVKARLRANVVKGNAPLLVTFDVLDTVDPAGGSIVDSSIDWSRLAGNATFDDKSVNIGDAVDCKINIPAEDKDVYGPAFRQCTFKYPGTYVATVTIKSNDPSKYVSGRSSVVIKVNPPNTRIDLKLKMGSQVIPIISYYENGVLKLDRDEVTVTLDEAKYGITFDASKTENVEFIRWDFGNGEVKEGQDKSPEIKFKEIGKYPIVLEVTNKLNQIDRKIFTLDVAKIAARLRTSSQTGFINSPITFDASDSVSDLGKIVNYEWKISPSSNQPVIPDDLKTITKSGKNTSFVNEFKYPLKYDLSVKVTDSAQNSAEEFIRNFKVGSNPPRGLFEFLVNDKTQPGTYTLDGSKSFDPDGTKDLDYFWKIEPETGWKAVDVIKHGLNSKDPIIKFTEKGKYDITLLVSDKLAPDEFNELKQSLNVENVLDVAWAKDQLASAILNKSGQVEFPFKIVSDTATAYEINFGDGETKGGELKKNVTINHLYKESGKYQVRVTVFDAEDNDNSITRRFFIGDSTQPIAKIGLAVNGEEIYDFTKTPKVSTKDVITFDATNSKNVDGTGRNLTYSWNFGDSNISSQKKPTHIFKELSPKDPGYYSVKLTVTDKDNPSLTDTDEILISVINLPPTFSVVQGVAQPLKEGDFVTPLTVKVQAYGAEDRDGEITQYRWWYFDVDDPDEPLGIQITNNPSAQLIIGTRGKERQEITYGFGLELTDSQDLKYSNSEEIEAKRYSTITVINGKNAQPISKFNVDNTSIFVNEKVTFTSSSTDPDGKIVSYIWDFEGDGFYNNTPTKDSSISHKYTTKNKDGFGVRLKVIDDKGGEDVSDPIKVFVDSLSKPPKAAFTFEVVKSSKGLKIKFKNNSIADEESGAKIMSNKWDFDTSSSFAGSDSDGDGIKDNDEDSSVANPEHVFNERGTYMVKLTVIDNQGNSTSVTNDIKIPSANPPKAAFTYEIVDSKMVFHNNSIGDQENGVTLKEYIWDFDASSQLITADSDGDGDKTDDKDSTSKDPTYTYKLPGNYDVKLTVVDELGNKDSVTRTINYGIKGILETQVIKDPTDSDNTNKTGPKAQLTTIPEANNGIVNLSGDKGPVKFNFVNSKGAIANYSMDKNIYFDTDGNGVKNDDQDFKTTLPGSWTTNFEKAWGKTVAKLTVSDIYGNQDSQTIEIKFK